MTEASKTSRVKDAYERLKDEIRTNRLPPGFQAPEPEIAVRLGMSRTPVREALIRLEAEGLVELTPRRGARVLPVRADDMREIYEILTSLEPDAAAMLAECKPTDEQLAPLVQATSDMEQALETEDLDRWAEADDRFHLTLLELQSNRRLQGFIRALYDQAHRARIVTLRLRGAPRKSTEEHREILEHLRRGDGEATRQAFKRHRQRAAVELLAILEKYKLGQL
ncbi:MAG: GntR family transcriptional regulator [Pseudomonadota bacterium]